MDFVANFFLFVGRMGNFRKGEGFPLMDCVSKRMIVWNEPNTTSEDATKDTIKMVFAGDHCPAAIKFKGPGMWWWFLEIAKSFSNDKFPVSLLPDPTQYAALKVWIVIVTTKVISKVISRSTLIYIVFSCKLYSFVTTLVFLINLVNVFILIVILSLTFTTFRILCKQLIKSCI